MTDEQRGFVRFVNQLSMVSLGAFVSQVVWVVGSLTFTYLVWWLATHEKAYIELAIALLAAWTGKSVTNAVSNYGTRKTAKEYAPVAEATERGKAQGKAIGEAITMEHDAPKPVEQPGITVTAKDQSTVKVDASPEPAVSRRRSSELPTPEVATTDTDTVEHVWARGEPREGIL
jgi:hypothetical protein